MMLVTPPRRNKSRGKPSPGPRGAGSLEIEERRYPRKLLPGSQWLECEGVGAELHGQISVVGLGGAFIRTSNLYPVGRPLGLRIRKDGEWIEAVCVVRSKETEGMGVEFMPPRTQLLSHLSEVLGEPKS